MTSHECRGPGGVQVLEHPPDGRLRRKSLSHLKAQGLQVAGGQVRGVLPYRCQAPATVQHPRHGQRQHRRQVMAYPAPVAGIGKVPKEPGPGAGATRQSSWKMTWRRDLTGDGIEQTPSSSPCGSRRARTNTPDPLEIRQPPTDFADPLTGTPSDLTHGTLVCCEWFGRRAGVRSARWVGLHLETA